MPNVSEIVYLRGKLHWAKVLGDPVDDYDKTGKEWAFDLALDSDGVRQMNALKVQGKPVKNIKDKGDERGEFINFRQRYREIGDSGKFTQPITVLDAAGKPWNQDEKIGNGTVADVKFKVVDYGKGKYAGVYPMAIRVLDHVPYQDQTFAPLSEDDKFFKSAGEAEAGYQGGFTNEDTEDDIPF